MYLLRNNLQTDYNVESDKVEAFEGTFRLFPTFPAVDGASDKKKSLYLLSFLLFT